jgi:hypothetical protein
MITNSSFIGYSTRLSRVWTLQDSVHVGGSVLVLSEQTRRVMYETARIHELPEFIFCGKLAISVHLTKEMRRLSFLVDGEHRNVNEVPGSS